MRLRSSRATAAHWVCRVRRHHPDYPQVLSPQPLSHARGAWVRRGPAQSRSAIAPAIIAAPVTQGELPVWRIAGLVIAGIAVARVFDTRSRGTFDLL